MEPTVLIHCVFINQKIALWQIIHLYYYRVARKIYNLFHTKQIKKMQWGWLSMILVCETGNKNKNEKLCLHTTVMKLKCSQTYY